MEDTGMVFMVGNERAPPMLPRLHHVHPLHVHPHHLHQVRFRQMHLLSPQPQTQSLITTTTHTAGGGNVPATEKAGIRTASQAERERGTKLSD